MSFVVFRSNHHSARHFTAIKKWIRIADTDSNSVHGRFVNVGPMGGRRFQFNAALTFKFLQS